MCRKSTVKEKILSYFGTQMNRFFNELSFHSLLTVPVPAYLRCVGTRSIVSRLSFENYSHHLAQECCYCR